MLHLKLTMKCVVCMKELKLLTLVRFFPTLGHRRTGYISAVTFIGVICILVFPAPKIACPHPTGMQLAAVPRPEQYIPFRRGLLHPKQQPASRALTCDSAAQRLQSHQAPNQMARGLLSITEERAKQRESRSPPGTDRFIINVSNICMYQ